jgi:hypothetical protein
MYAATDDVIAAFDSDGYGLLLNLRTGAYHPVNDTMADIWVLLEEGHDLETVLQILAHARNVTAQMLRIDAGEEIRKLQRFGMLIPQPKAGHLAARFGTTAPPPSRRVAIDTTDDHVPARYTAAASAGFLAAIALQVLPFRVRLDVMRASRRLRPQRPTLADTRRMVAAVKRVSRFHAGWDECYEISIGALLALALLGKAPTWLLQARFGQIQLHACLEVNDIAIDHESQGAKEAHPLIRV